ncbi:unnamed protein product [Brachionus calyciflorus]|uniref:Uncharacterized protein n=1 Tax=Brachionus calyciflorus TaxID=104777 RepID=A0A814L7J6_9BILA|nr:unnamed protein product [Brachionus calyciflorus]
MSNNTEKLKRIEYLNERNEFIDKFDSFLSNRNDTSFFLNDFMSKLINQIDMRREIIKEILCKEIDDYAVKLVEKTKILEKEFDENFKKCQIIRNNIDINPNLPIENRIDSYKEAIQKIKHSKFVLDEFENLVKSCDQKIQRDQEFKFSFDKFLLEKLFCDLNYETIKEIKPKAPKFEKINIKKTIKLNGNMVGNIEQLKSGEIVIALTNGYIKLFNPNTGDILRELKIDSGQIEWFGTTENDEIIVSDKQMNVSVWNKDTGRLEFKVENSNFIEIVNILCNKQLDNDPIQEVKSKRIAKSICQKFQRDFNCFFLFDTNRLLCATNDKIEEWDVIKFKNVGNFEGHSNTVCCITKLNDNEFLSGCINGSIKLWDINSKMCINTFTEHTGPIRCLQVCKDNHLMSYSHDGFIKIWNLNLNKCLSSFKNRETFSTIKILKSGQVVTFDKKNLNLKISN